MAFCIMRFEKHKAANIAALAGSLSHTFRSRYTPNAVPELVKDNAILKGPARMEDVAAEIRARWPERIRSNAVGFIEFFIGASPEWFSKHGGDGDHEGYFRRTVRWLENRFGAENVVSVVQHNDETSPHLAAYVVPIRPDSGALSAKYYIDGPRDCSELQTDFHQSAGRPFGLERGVKGSTAEHMSIKRWYEQHASLDARARELRYDTYDITARETEIQEDRQQLDARQKQLDIRERQLREQDVEQQRRGYELHDKEEALDKRAATLAASRRSLDEAAETLAGRERAVEALAERMKGLQRAVERREAEVTDRERRLAALSQQIAERGERLKGGRAALEKRQAEIDQAGEQLRQRLAAAREQQQAWEARRDAWLAENRPPAVPELVRHLQHLQHLQSLSVLDSAEYLAEQDSDELYALFTPQDGLTPHGKALMAQHGDAADQRQRWEHTMESQSGPSGPGR